MATPTYTLIDSVTLGSSASSVTFSGISATGKGDLVLIVGNLLVSTVTNSYMFMRFNGDSTTTYNSVVANGNGSTTTSASWANADSFQALYNLDITTPSTSTYQILDYSATDKHKSVLQRSSSPSKFAEMYAHRWANTSAINSVNVFLYSGTFNSGTTFHLYQIVSE